MTTSFGTSYLPLSAYELVNGVLVPKGGASSSDGGFSGHDTVLMEQMVPAFF